MALAASPTIAARPVPAASSEAGAPWLRLESVGKRFGAMRALSDVSLNIRAGEIQCLLGENGAGKSTLCNLIFGVHAPSEGRMMLDGAPYRPQGPADALKRGIAMVHQHFSLVADMTVLDNLLLGQSRGLLRRGEEGRRIAALAQRYGLVVDLGARVDALSVGERQRVEIIKCLMRAPRLLVLDEPTAVLLPEEIAALLAVCQEVARDGCSVLLVTHKLAEIRQVAHRVTVLRGGAVVAESEQASADMERLVRAMIQRDVASDVATIHADDHAGDAAAANAPSFRRPRQASAEVLQIDGLSVIDAQGVTRLDNFTHTLYRGEIVGIAGVEGNGQSELAAALSGMIRPSAGRFFLDGQPMHGKPPREITRAGLGIVPEDRHAHGCINGLSVAENLFLNRFEQFTRWGRVDRRAMAQAARELMARYDVRAASVAVAFGGLSGGNQQKAVMARELTLPGLIALIAAQPTRGLDVGAVEAVYGHIRRARDEGVGVLLISSELDELLTVADRILVLYRGRIVGECAAGLDQRERIGAMMAGHL